MAVFEVRKTTTFNHVVVEFRLPTLTRKEAGEGKRGKGGEEERKKGGRRGTLQANYQQRMPTTDLGEG